MGKKTSTLETPTYDTVYVSKQPCKCCGFFMGLDISSVVNRKKITAKDVRELRELQTNECSICLVDYKAGDVTRTLPVCGHTFHERCVWSWTLEQEDIMSCPLCRAEIDDNHFHFFRMENTTSHLPGDTGEGASQAASTGRRNAKRRRKTQADATAPYPVTSRRLRSHAK